MLKRALLALCTLAVLASCKKSDDAAGPTYDRAALLANAADSFIIPAYTRLSAAADSQAAAINHLCAAPTAERLAEARNAYKTAYMAGQGGIYFDFGPADLNGGMFWASLNTFPLDVAKVEQAILAGTAAPVTSRYHDRVGFAALDYLLFADSANTLSALANPSRAAYLSACAQDIAAKSRTIAQAWPAYREAFVAANGTEAGSGTSAYYNAYVYGYEVVKNLKVALPAGKMAGQTITEPTRVEALYSGLGAQALRANVELAHRLYTGRTGDADGIGWADYLNALPGGAALVTTTEVQFQAVQTAADGLPNQPLSITAQAPDPTLLHLNDEMQMTTRYLKADMSSLLGIAITFSSGDGD